MVQFSAGVETCVMDTINILSLMCIRPAIQREPAGMFTLIKAVGAWNTNLYSVSRWRTFGTISLLTCKPSWRSNELSTGNSSPFTLCCCGKPSRRYSEHAIF